MVEFVCENLVEFAPDVEAKSNFRLDNSVIVFIVMTVVLEVAYATLACARPEFKNGT